MEGSSTMDQVVKNTQENMSWLSIWWQQFVDASMMPLMASFSNGQVQRHPPVRTKLRFGSFTSGLDSEQVSAPTPQDTEQPEQLGGPFQILLIKNR
ncbi:hypothetical protein ZEAMMB73_Zm00001d033165 [Zea mays]|uniref:Uncharacterized protein n=1 Tax=Zea mays TaxID=4577 RepID=A0A1D6KWP8_MAIZE|nr:hypothetical protein ZEAMMB73_Zm00001d033165 [Zea mays]